MKLRLQKFIGTLLLVLLVLFSESQNKRPNIILICADDLGWSDLGCYGSEIQTPNLDKLATNGLRFNRFHNTSKCFPSRTCLLTGVYAQDSGTDTVYFEPINNAVTIGEVLRESGYSTYWSGKHHGIENPEDRGFDKYYGLLDGGCNHFNPGLQREGEPKPAQKRYRTWYMDGVTYCPYTPEKKDFYTTDYFTNHALEFIDKAKQSNKPFFLYLAYTAPHYPLMAWPDDIAKYKGKYDLGYDTIRHKRFEKQKRLGIIDSEHTLSQPTYEDWSELTIEEKNNEIKKMEVYAAMIDRMDQNIGRILEKLEESKLGDNTLILFVSDNGAEQGDYDIWNDNDNAEIGSINNWVSLGENWANVCNTPFRYYKTFSYEGGINTPFIAYWPQIIQPETFTDFTGHFIDIMPTLIEICGATYPTVYNNQEIKPLRGQSLLPIFYGDIKERIKPIFWNWDKGSAVFYQGWKIVRLSEDDNWDLYNLKNDPCEINNLASEHPEIVYDLNERYDIWTINSEKDITFNNTSNDSIKINYSYPKKQLTIEQTNYNEITINIFDYKGALIFSEKSHRIKSIVNTNNLAPGIYILKVNQNRDLIVQKFLI